MVIESSKTHMFSYKKGPVSIKLTVMGLAELIPMLDILTQAQHDVMIAIREEESLKANPKTNENP